MKEQEQIPRIIEKDCELQFQYIDRMNYQKKRVMRMKNELEKMTNRWKMRKKMLVRRMKYVVMKMMLVLQTHPQ